MNIFLFLKNSINKAKNTFFVFCQSICNKLFQPAQTKGDDEGTISAYDGSGNLKMWPTPVESIEFTFNQQKAIQAAALFLKLRNTPDLKHLALIKLLYIADRRSIEKFNHPITGDRYFSMKYGPVLSQVYDLIKDNKIVNPNLWIEYIAKVDECSVKLIKDPGKGDLSKREEKLIMEVHEDYKSYNEFYLAELTHGFPEWTDPITLGKKQIRIDNLWILKCLRKTEKEIQFIQESSEIDEYVKYLSDILDT